MNIARYGIALGALALILVLSSALFTVDETEQAIILQFGEPVGQPIREAGLHVKMPFIQNVLRFEKRVLEWDGRPTQVPTEEKKSIIVDTFARWRISEPLQFYQAVRGIESTAQGRLDNIINGVTRDLVTQSKLIEVVRNSNRTMQGRGEDDLVVELTGIDKIERGRSGITRQVLENSRETVAQYGIELLDVQIKQINYTETVQKDVFQRMISERRRIAEKFRSEGQGERARIDGKKDRELKRIESEAYRKAQEIIGEADAEAARIYANAFNRDPEFYSFLQTLDSYRTTLDSNSTVIMKTDSEYLKYLKKIGTR